MGPVLAEQGGARRDDHVGTVGANKQGNHADQIGHLEEEADP